MRLPLPWWEREKEREKEKERERERVRDGKPHFLLLIWCGKDICLAQNSSWRFSMHTFVQNDLSLVFLISRALDGRFWHMGISKETFKSWKAKLKNFWRCWDSNRGSLNPREKPKKTLPVSPLDHADPCIVEDLFIAESNPKDMIPQSLLFGPERACVS